MDCPCCGQPYPLETGKLSYLDSYRIVSNGIEAVTLTPTQYKIMLGVRQRSRSLDELVNYIYGERPDGGPVTARNCLAVIMSKLNARLAPLGVRVGAERKGAWAPPYKIEHVDR